MGRGALSVQNEDPTPQDGWEQKKDQRLARRPRFYARATTAGTRARANSVVLDVVLFAVSEIFEQRLAELNNRVAAARTEIRARGQDLADVSSCLCGRLWPFQWRDLPERIAWGATKWMLAT